jgi:hypothetical protein
MRKIKNKKGSALAYALVITSTAMIILVSMLGYIVSQLKFSSNRVEKEKAFQIAEAGIFWYRWYLAHEVAGKTAQEINNFWQSRTAYGDLNPYEQEFFDLEGGAIGKYRIEIDPPESGSTIVIVKSTGWTYKMPDVTRTVQVRFRRPSWSEYSVLANDFMRFGEGTNVFGKIHSNKGIRFDGTANNIIFSSVANFDDPDHSGGVEFGVHTHRRVPPLTGISSDALSSEMPPTNPVPMRSDVFLAGRQFPVPEVSFNGVLSDLNFMKTQSQIIGSGLYFDDSDEGRHIILKTNGTMDVRNVLSYNTSSNSITSEGAITTYSIPDGGVVFVENNVWIEGSINDRRITIVAANLIGGNQSNVYVGMNNILYTNSDGSDVIGIIAQKDIEVIRDSQDFLTIDAALLAQSGRVGREHYNTWCTSWHKVWWWWVCDSWATDHKNTITVNGSMATNLRYGFAYTDGTGYTNRILNFDNNLLYYPPPYFPTGTEYSIDLWEEL